MTDGVSTAADAFALLSDEIRLAIVEELSGESYRGLRPTEGRSFTDLRRAVGVRDAGQFNYHLGELLGTFVRKVGDGYALTNAGWTVAGIVAAGEVGGEDVYREGTLDTTCSCGEPLVGTYEDDLFRVACPDHGVQFATRLPTGVVPGRSLDEVLTLACVDMQADLDRATMGVCPHCRGDVAVTVLPDETVSGVDERVVLVECDCRDCGLRFCGPPGLVVRSHPAVVSFFHDHAVDVRTLTYPELTFLEPTLPTVRQTDPLLVELDLEHDGDRLTVVLDEHARVVGTDRD